MYVPPQARRKSPRLDLVDEIQARAEFFELGQKEVLNDRLPRAGRTADERVSKIAYVEIEVGWRACGGGSSATAAPQWFLLAFPAGCVWNGASAAKLREVIAAGRTLRLKLPRNCAQSAASKRDLRGL